MPVRRLRRGTERDVPEGGPGDLGFFRALCEGFPDGLLIADAEGRIVRVNERLEEMSGYTRDEILGRPVEILVPESSRAGHARERSRFVSEPRVRHMGSGIPIWLRRKDGSELPVDIGLAPLTTPGGFLVASAIRDDTARRRAEELLRQSEARYRRLVERIPAVTHVSRLDPTASTLYISPQVEAVLGYTPHEWEADDELWVRLLFADDRAEALAANTRLIETGEPLVLDYRMVARDGRVVWIHEESEVIRDDAGTPLFCHGILLDVTERKRAEEEMRVHIRQLAAVAELGQLAVVGEPPGAVMDRAVELVAESLDVEYAKVLELLPDGQELLLRAGVGWREGLVGRATVPAGAGSQAGFTLLSDEPVVVEDLATERRFRGPSLLLDHGVVSGVSVAIRGRERPFGVLGVHTTRRRAFPAYAVDLLRSIAAVLANAIERDEADRVVRTSGRRLAHAQEIAHLGSWDWDIVADQVAWSDEVYRIFGLAPQGSSPTYGVFVDATHPDDQTSVERAVRAAVEGGEPYAIDHRIVRPDGTERIVHEKAEVVVDEEGNAIKVVGTVQDITERRRAEEELERTLERLQRTDAERRRLLAHLVKAREEEQARIAGDIHDDPLQKIAALSLRVGMLKETLRERGQIELIDAVEGTVSQVLGSLRTLLFELRPLSLDREGLAAALRELLQRVAEDAPVAFAVADRMAGEPTPESRVICYRIAQEAIGNVRKHARATRVEVELGSEGDGTRVMVRDDGVGFIPERVPPAPGHLGLPDMRERAELAGGWLRITSAPGAGTAVEFWIPGRAA